MPTVVVLHTTEVSDRHSLASEAVPPICPTRLSIVAPKPDPAIVTELDTAPPRLPASASDTSGPSYDMASVSVAVLSPIVFISGVALWLAVSRLTKLASLASILAVAVLPIGMVVVGRDLWEVLTTIGLCAIVMSRHIGNMRRLVTATEHRI